MLNRITILALASVALGGAALPATAMAADYYGGGDGAPYAFHSRDDVEIDGDRARFDHRQDFRSAPRGYDAPDRAYPGPVVFDERETYRRRVHPAYGYGDPAFGERRPIAAPPAYGDGGVAYVPFSHPYPPAYGGPAFGASPPYRSAVGYREVSAPVGPNYGGGPDVGCTIEQAQSTTPAGWRKTVTHKTCYRR